MYEYRVFQFLMPQLANQVAAKLHSLIQAQQAEGFEYLRMDHVSHYEAPGCLAALFGAGGTWRQIDLAVFRRRIG